MGRTGGLPALSELLADPLAPLFNRKLRLERIPLIDVRGVAGKGWLFPPPPRCPSIAEAPLANSE